MSEAAAPPMPAPPVIGESTRLGAAWCCPCCCTMLIPGLAAAVEDAAR